MANRETYESTTLWHISPDQMEKLEAQSRKGHEIVIFDRQGYNIEVRSTGDTLEIDALCATITEEKDGTITISVPDHPYGQNDTRTGPAKLLFKANMQYILNIL